MLIKQLCFFGPTELRWGFYLKKMPDYDLADDDLADDKQWRFFFVCLGASICYHVNEV